MAQSHGIFQPPFDRVENHQRAQNEVRDAKDRAPFDPHAMEQFIEHLCSSFARCRAPTFGKFNLATAVLMVAAVP
jgi:response regulator RpfG family c-di-GMP phosphodiesterase